MRESQGHEGKTFDMRAAAVKIAQTGLVSLASIALSLWITPMQEVSAAGQTIRVGATAPAANPSGPGELDLFGQSIPTTLHFAGPVGPRLSLTNITFSEQLNQLIAVGVLVTEGLNVEAIMVTAYTAPAKLSTVRSLQDLVGGSPSPPVKRGDSRPSSPIHTVAVVGDSAAVGLGMHR